ncbi:hypothetical protein SAMN02910456_00645 [Ruminococcaceae bacterium YRB3002]|nr:hypothetical protein SAMN02910456_00645 [Ruminococcaceae bacterium YRB3002]
MKRFKERLIALLSAAAIVVSSSGIAALAYTKDQLPSYIKTVGSGISVSSVSRQSGGAMAWDPKKVEPTYRYKVDGYSAMCASASLGNPAGTSGKAYELDATSLSKYSVASGNSKFFDASNDPVVTGNSNSKGIWNDALSASNLKKLNDYEIYQRLLAVIYKNSYTRDLKVTRTNVTNAISEYNKYGTGKIENWGGYSLISSSDSSNIGNTYSGLYGTVHAMMSYLITDRWEERYSVTSMVVIGNSSASKSRSSAVSVLKGYFNEIASMTDNDYKSFLYIASNSKTSPDSGPQWLIYVTGEQNGPKAAYAGFSIIKESATGDKMHGAEFTVYSDKECSKVLGKITDTDGNGIYSNYSTSESFGDDSQYDRTDRLRLKEDKDDDDIFERTVYIKETKAPDTVDGISLSEELIDTAVYKVSFHYDRDTRKLTYKVLQGSTELASDSFSGVDAETDLKKAVICNSNTISTSKFIDGAAVRVVKDTHNGYSVKNTHFAIYNGTATSGSVVASHDVTGAGDVWEYPLMANSQYTIVETYTVDNYTDTDIPYEVENTSDGWKKVDTNKYSYTFTTGVNGDVVSFTEDSMGVVYNDRVTVKIGITKTANDGAISGREFCFYYLGKTTSQGKGTLLAKVKTDEDGKITINLPTGFYRIHETADPDYRLTWGNDVTVRDGDAIVELTRAESNLGNNEGIKIVANNDSYFAPIRVNKVDLKMPETELKGATFALYADTNGNDKFDIDSDGIAQTYVDGSWINTKIAPKNGYYEAVYGENNTTALLRTGKYFVVEVVAPELYVPIAEAEVAEVPSISVVEDPSHPMPIKIKIVNDTDFGTVASGVEETKVIEYKEDAVITDTVHFANLIADKEYTLTGTLHINKDGNDVDTGISVTRTFKPSDEDVTVIKSVDAADGTKRITGSVNVSFTFDARLYTGETLVAFETLKPLENGPYVHADIEDAAQSIPVPKIETSVACDQTGTREVKADSDVTLTDTVSYSNLMPGITYVVRGRLLQKTENGGLATGITAESEEFTPDKPDGTVEVKFSFNTKDYVGKTFVVFEKVYAIIGEKEYLVSVHEELTDKKQTVYVPEIKTRLTDQDGTKVPTYSETATLNDAVSYSNLQFGKTYTMTGTLRDVSTGKAILDADNNPITNSVQFTPTLENSKADSNNRAYGTVIISFKVDITKCAGKALVATETLDNDLAIHYNLQDQTQTVYIPEIRTTLVSNTTKEHISAADKEAKLVDTVSYKNLYPGTYIVRGVLMDKNTGKAILDPNGKQITANATFVVKEVKNDNGDIVPQSGTVNVTFILDTTVIKGISAVAFEEVYLGKKLVASHKDIKDVDQTVEIPEIKTTLVDDATKTHTASFAEKVKLVDTVSYSHLIVGRTYVMTGTLMDKATNKPLLNENGKAIVVTKEFTPESSDGTVEIEFIINTKVLAGVKDEIVAFERCSEKGKDYDVAIHTDINDKDQTVRVPVVHTDAAFSSGKKVSKLSKSTTIVDTITYSGLTPGHTYAVHGTVMVKGTNKPLVIDGNEVALTAMFKPDKADGTTKLSMTFNSKGLSYDTVLVVFEEIYDVQYDEAGKSTLTLVASHQDINDKDQTVKFVPPYAPQTGEGAGYFFIGLASVMIGCGIGCIILFKKRKED